MKTSLIAPGVTIPSEVIARFACKVGLTADNAKQRFSDLLSFLDQAAFQSCSPTREVDEVWHEFILHTRAYAEFCRLRYARFVHHTPTSPTKCKASDDGEDAETDDEEGDCSSACLLRTELTADCESDGGGNRCSSDCRGGGDDS